MKNKRLNFWYFVISSLVITVVFILDKLLLININKVIYYSLAGPTIGALGNYIVIRIQMKKQEMH